MKVKYHAGNQRRIRFHRYTVIHIGTIVLSTDDSTHAALTAQQIFEATGRVTEAFDTQAGSTGLSYIFNSNAA